MKTILNEALDFFSFLLLMGILGFSAMVYGIFIMGYWVYAKVTGQEHLIQ